LVFAVCARHAGEVGYVCMSNWSGTC